MNPFVFDRPLEAEETFVGREDLLNWVGDFVLSGQPPSLALLQGAGGLGRSSFVARLEKAHGDDAVIMLKANLGELSSESETALLWDTVKAFSGSLLRQGLSPPPIEKSLLVLNPQRNFEVNYWRAVDKIVGQRRLLIVLDNADRDLSSRAKRLPLRSLFHYLAQLERHAGEVKFLLTLQTRPVAFEGTEFSPFYEATARRLPPLSFQEARKLLRQTRATFFPHAVCNYIRALTQGHPADIQRLGHALHERCIVRRLRTVTTADVLAVLAYDTEALDFYGPVYRRRREIVATVAQLAKLDNAR